jgi:hypothetical protein
MLAIPWEFFFVTPLYHHNIHNISSSSIVIQLQQLRQLQLHRLVCVAAASSIAFGGGNKSTSRVAQYEHNHYTTNATTLV